MPEQDEFSVQRYRGGFAIVWRDATGQRHRHTLVADNRPSAEAEARARWQAGDDSPWTVGRIIAGYLETLAGRPAHPRRVDAWKAMRGYWEAVDPLMIDDAMCRAYRASRRVGDATARLELMFLSTALNWAVTHKHIAMRRPIWLPPVPERKTRHLTRKEFEAFYDAMVAEHARVYAMIGLYTMARPGAILELTWDRVDFMRRLIDFNPAGRVQTAKRRPILPIGDRLLQALQRAHSARTSLYVVERGGRKVGNIKKAFQAASQRSGVHATPYTLRHTGAVWAAEGGIPMPELAQMMGHDDDRTTQRHYARYSPGYLRSVVEAIEGGAKVAKGSR